MTWWLLVVDLEAWLVPKKVKLFARLFIIYSHLLNRFLSNHTLTVSPHCAAAQLGQKVAVLDYVEPSAKGKHASDTSGQEITA